MDIDVSKCRFLNISKECRANGNVLCENIKDCYYKQLQQLKAENEKLKELLKQLSADEHQQLLLELYKNRQKLEKIKEIVKIACEDSLCHKNCEICSDGQILKIIESEE